MTGELFREIFLNPSVDSRSAGVQIGVVLFAPQLVADPTPDLVPEERTAVQLADVFTKMDNFLEAAGATRAAVVRVTVFMRDVLERPVLNDVWAKWYPHADDRPPHKYVPALHPDGVNVAIQVLGLLAGKREVFEIPGVQHSDPMSMGARTANLVTSSRLFGTQPDLQDQISLILERATVLLAQAGGTLSDLTQVTFFVGSPEVGEAVQARWDGVFPIEEDAPVLNIVEADLGGGNGWPRVEILGLIEP